MVSFLLEDWFGSILVFFYFLGGGLRGMMGFGDLLDGQKFVLSCVFFRVSLS